MRKDVAMTIDREAQIKAAIKYLLITMLAVASIALLIGWSEGHFESVETMQEYIDGFGVLGPLVLTIIQALQVILPILPGFLGCVAGTMMFGPIGGFLINYTGICAGSIAAYWLARIYGVKLVRQLINLDKYDHLIKWVNEKKYYTIILFFAILLPAVPDDFFCYFSGLTQTDSKKFTWIIIICKPWYILGYVMITMYAMR